MSRQVVVIIGVGGMGLEIARRLGQGKRLFLADYAQAALDTAKSALEAEGLEVDCYTVDVSQHSSVSTFARTAAAVGPLEAVILTAGVSPATATAKQIYEVDLLGTANVIDAFLTHASKGTSLVCISSMAGHMLPISPDLERHMALAPLGELLQHTEIDVHSSATTLAYSVAKRGNVCRVQAAARSWGVKGARINSVSPGVIATAMGERELSGQQAAQIKSMLDNAPLSRVGTPDDIASAVAFLTGPGSSYITGTDVLVDGGVVSTGRWL